MTECASCNGICFYITFLVMSVYSVRYTGTILIIDYKDYFQNIISVFKISEKWVSSEIKDTLRKLCFVRQHTVMYTGTILIIDYKDYFQNIISVFKISEKWVSSEIKRHITKTMLCQTTYTRTFKKSCSGSIL